MNETTPERRHTVVQIQVLPLKAEGLADARPEPSGKADCQLFQQLQPAQKREELDGRDLRWFFAAFGERTKKWPRSQGYVLEPYEFVYNVRGCLSGRN